MGHVETGPQHSFSSTTFSGPWEYSTMICDYGENALIKTAYTEANLGRRFWTCPYRKCKFFLWHDDVISDRGRGFGGKMMARVRILEDQLVEAKTETAEKIMPLEKEIKKLQKDEKAVEKELKKYKKWMFVVIAAVAAVGWMKLFV